MAIHFTTGMASYKEAKKLASLLTLYPNSQFTYLTAASSNGEQRRREEPRVVHCLARDEGDSRCEFSTVASLGPRSSEVPGQKEKILFDLTFRVFLFVRTLPSVLAPPQSSFIPVASGSSLTKPLRFISRPIDRIRMKISSLMFLCGCGGGGQRDTIVTTGSRRQSQKSSPAPSMPRQVKSSRLRQNHILTPSVQSSHFRAQPQTPLLTPTSQFLPSTTLASRPTPPSSKMQSDATPLQRMVARRAISPESSRERRFDSADFFIKKSGMVARIDKLSYRKKLSFGTLHRSWTKEKNHKTNRRTSSSSLSSLSVSSSPHCVPTSEPISIHVRRRERDDDEDPEHKLSTMDDGIADYTVSRTYMMWVKSDPPPQREAINA